MALEVTQMEQISAPNPTVSFDDSTAGGNNSALGSLGQPVNGVDNNITLPKIACGGHGFPPGILSSPSGHYTFEKTDGALNGKSVAIYGNLSDSSDPKFEAMVKQAAKLAIQSGGEAAVFIDGYGKVYVGNITMTASGEKGVDISHQVRYDNGALKVVSENEAGYEPPATGLRGGCGTPIVNNALSETFASNRAQAVYS